MPQGDKKVRTGARVKAAGAPYHKSKRDNTKKGGPVKAPKSEAGNTAQSTTFKEALPGMIRTFEQMAAGRVLLNGGKLTLGDLKDSGKTELREKRKQSGDKKEKRRASIASMKGLTKKDLVEEAEIEYLSSLTGQRLAIPTKAKSK